MEEEELIQKVEDINEEREDKTVKKKKLCPHEDKSHIPHVYSQYNNWAPIPMIPLKDYAYGIDS